MSADENRKRSQELRRIGFQRVLVGIVIIFGVGCICFIALDEDTGLPLRSYSGRRGFGVLLLSGVWGLWNIVRGVIYLIRAQSGDEHYANKVEDIMDKFESKQDEMLGRKMGPSGSMHNVLVLLVWVFLIIAAVGAIGVGYLFWTRR